MPFIYACTNPVALVRRVARETCRSGDWSWKVLRNICAGTCTGAAGGDGGGGGANAAHLAATVDFAAHLTHACTVGVGAANFDPILEYRTHAAAARRTKVSWTHHVVSRHSDWHAALVFVLFPVAVLYEPM